MFSPIGSRKKNDTSEDEDDDIFEVDLFQSTPNHKLQVQGDIFLYPTQKHKIIWTNTKIQIVHFMHNVDINRKN